MSHWDDEHVQPRAKSVSRTPSIAAISFGIVIQFVTGAMMFAIPPGGSLGAWLIYLALGLFGLMHIVLGAVWWNNQSETPAITAVFESDDIPWHAKRCPQCDGDIADALASGRRRCPACDTHFTTRDLGWRDFDPAGEPVTLSPNERRMNGRQLVAALAVLATAIIIVAVYAGVAWPGQPGP